MPDTRLVVTFASTDRQELPWLVEGTTAAHGMPVQIADGVVGRLHTPAVFGRKALGNAGGTGPDLLNLIQVVIDVAVPVAVGAIGNLIAMWAWSKRQQRPDGSERPPGDMTVIVYVNSIQVGSSADEIASVVRESLAAGSAPIEIPRSIRENNAAAFAMSLEEFDDLLDR